VANLLLVRASERRKEIAIRLAIGAGRGRLMRQLLTESMLLALMGGALGLLFALWTARLIVAFKPPLAVPLSLDVALDVKVLVFTMGLALVTGLVCGLAPALQASKPDLVGTLRDDSAGPGRRHRRLGLRNILVIAQVAISTVLLVGAGLFLRSLGQASSIDPGFKLRKGVAAQLVVGLGGAYTDAQARAFYQRLLDRARAIPGVRSAAYAEHDGPDAPKVVIVNETAAKRFWPGEAALGKHLRFGKDAPWLTVVGVARDGKYRTLGEDPRPFAYTAVEQDKSFGRTLVVAGDGDEKVLLGEVRRAIDATDPNVPIFDIKTMSEHLSIMLFLARMGAILLAAFGGLGLILASMGLYGVVAASVARRT